MSYSAPAPGPMSQPESEESYSQQPYEGQPAASLQATSPEPAGQPYAQAPESFVPKKRFQMGRLTRILLAVLLVAVGFFGGVGVTKLMDAGQTRPGRGQFQNLNGGQGRNRQNGAPTNGVSPSAIPSAPTTAGP